MCKRYHKTEWCFVCKIRRHIYRNRHCHLRGTPGHVKVTVEEGEELLEECAECVAKRK